MRITQSTLRKIIREELQEAYKSEAQRDKELNAEIRMIKKDPEFRALVALEKAYHGRKRSIDDPRRCNERRDTGHEPRFARVCY